MHEKVFGFIAKSAIILCTTFLTASQAIYPDSGSSTNCSAYCSDDGVWKPEFPCPGTLFCCGQSTRKFCCDDVRMKNLEPEKYTCANTKQFSYSGWIVVIVMILTVLVIFVGLISCVCAYFHKGRCCCCCLCKNSRDSESGLFFDRSLSQQELSVGSERPHRAPDFDPTSSCAFSPPPYEALPKNPPPYSEIFTISNGCDGNASGSCASSAEDDNIRSNSPPPPFLSTNCVQSSVNGNQSEQLPSSSNNIMRPDSTPVPSPSVC